MARTREASGVPSTIERFVKSLVVTAKAVVLYPPSSNMPLQTAEDTQSLLNEALRERSELRLAITADELAYRNKPLFPGSAAYSAFASDLHRRGLTEVRFHSGAGARDIVAFLSVLKYEPEQIEAAGGYEGRLWDQGVDTITVSERREVADEAAEAAGNGSSNGFTRTEIEEIVSAAGQGSVDERAAAMSLLEDAAVLGGYLAEIFTVEEPEGGPIVAADRLAELVAVALLPGDPVSREGGLDSLASALVRLDADARRILLTAHLQRASAAGGTAAELVRHLGPESACEILAGGVDQAGVSAEEMAQAIHALTHVLKVPKDEIVELAGSALSREGLSDTFAAEVMELLVSDRAYASDEADSEPKPVSANAGIGTTNAEAVTAPSSVSGLENVAAEANLGISDGDVAVAMAFLVGMNLEDEHFVEDMAALEERLDVLIASGELEAAADAADVLRAAARDQQTGAAERERLAAAMGRFSKPADLRTIARALHTFVPGTAEYDAARRLVDALGDSPIEPLLEQLADEPDMGLRKSLVDLLSLVAPRHIPEFGARIGDPRWYVVRNIVCVLGSTRSSAVLPYLQRTLRHTEPRVRRETVRALSGIDDRVAHELLTAALSDEDDQNVQLAARYLGAAGVASAAPALQEVARGEGRGSREMGPRVEAVEALGKIGGEQSMRVLESLAGRRAIVRGARGRELRAAAEAAIDQLRSQGGDS